jgi:hypothetical protein
MSAGCASTLPESSICHCLQPLLCGTQLQLMQHLVEVIPAAAAAQPQAYQQQTQTRSMEGRTAGAVTHSRACCHTCMHMPQQVTPTFTTHARLKYWTQILACTRPSNQQQPNMQRWLLPVGWPNKLPYTIHARTCLSARCSGGLAAGTPAAPLLSTCTVG